MKIFKILFLITFFTISYNTSFSQTVFFNAGSYKYDCIPTDNFCVALTRSVTFSPIGFPKCKLNILYKYRNCKDYNYEILSWTMNALSSKECDEFFIYAKSQLKPNTASLGNEAEVFWKDMEKQVFTVILNTINTNIIVNSGNPNFFDCNNPKPQNVTVKYYKASCVALWTGQDNFEQFVAAQVPCEGSTCCNRISTSCYDTKTGKVITKTSNEKAINQGCNSKEKPPFPTIEASWDKVTSCFPFCTEEKDAIFKTQTNSNNKDEIDFEYNNPASDILNVKLINSNEGTLILYSIDGQSYRQTVVNGDNIELNVGDLPKGIYILSWAKDNTIISKKVILN